MSDKIEAFNAVAGFYDDWYEHPQGKQVFLAERDAVEHLIPETGLGVEIGAGTGAFAESLTNEDRIILCLDPSKEMLGKAQKRGLSCILGVGDWLPLRENLIDFSYMITVLEFLNDPVRLFKEILNQTKKDASFTVLFINSESSWGDLYRDIGSKGDTVFQHAKLYTLSEVMNLLESAGYRVVETQGTLNSSPTSQEIDCSLIDPCGDSGVIVVRAE